MSGYNTVYICNATAGNVTLVLPDAATASARSYVYVVKKADASANACVVTPQGGDTVDGSNRLALNTYLGASTLMASAPGYWWVVSH
jgi:hypothetical protein